MILGETLSDCWYLQLIGFVWWLEKPWIPQALTHCRILAVNQYFEYNCREPDGSPWTCKAKKPQWLQLCKSCMTTMFPATSRKGWSLCNLLGLQASCKSFLITRKCFHSDFSATMREVNRFDLALIWYGPSCLVQVSLVSHDWNQT